jgi:predicted MFS family arabinose efflux permease
VRNVSESPSYSRLLKQPPFRALWLAQIISQSGDAIFDVALLWLVLITTGSAALVGLTQAIVLIPPVFAKPFAGVYADRSNRRNIMILSSLFQGGVTAVLSFLYLANVLHFAFLIFLVLLLYTGAEFFRSANVAMVPSIVSKENLGAANGLFTLTTSANQLASYTVGGVVLATVGAAVSITYDSLTFFVAAALLTLVAKSYGQTAAMGSPGGGSFKADFREGVSYVRKSRLFLELIVTGIIINFFGAVFATGMAPYVKNQLSGGAVDYGVVLSSFALGTIAGSLALGKVNFRSFVGRLVFAGVIVSGVLMFLAGEAVNVPEGILIALALGALIGIINLPIQVLVQTQVPGEILGRAATVLGSLLAASQPVGALVFGAMVGVISIGETFMISGAIVSVVSAVLFFLFKELSSAKY